MYEAGERLDRYLAATLPDVSRSLIKRHIEAGAVLIDGELPIRGPRTAVRVGTTIRYAPPPPESFDLQPQDIPITIVHEDADIVVVDKPSGLVVHPAIGHPSGTLVNALLFHVKDFERADEDHRPGIVHRLDRETSGLMVVAKHRLAHQRLVESFQARTVHKVYLAFAHGIPTLSKGTLNTLIGRHPKDRKRFSSKVTQGKNAISHYTVLTRFQSASLIEVRIETGRTHQIRVHLTDLGHPLIGDSMYGNRRPSRDPDVGPIVNRFERAALHAHQLAFDHPMQQERLTFTAPLPDDLQALRDDLDTATQVASKRR